MLYHYLIECCFFFLINYFSYVQLETIILQKNISASNFVVLDCQLSSEDSTSVVWQHINIQNKISIISVNVPTLHISSLNDVGLYFCKVNGTFIRNFTVAYLATPTILVSLFSITIILH